MWHASGKGDVFTRFLLGGSRVGDHWEDLGIGGREGNIKMDLREIGIDGANWSRLAQDRV
jgi:hypothetical protein